MGLAQSRTSGSWSQVKAIDDRTGFIDLILDPRSPDTLYAASYRREAGPWFFRDRSRNNGIWKTVDGGKSWTRLTRGLPRDEYVGRIGISLSAARPEVVYARIVHDKLGPDGKPLGGEHFNGEEIYRSDDGGESWRMTAEFNQMKTPLDRRPSHRVPAEPLLHDHFDCRVAVA
jgi:hypothetical protein